MSCCVVVVCCAARSPSSVAAIQVIAIDSIAINSIGDTNREFEDNMADTQGDVSSATATTANTSGAPAAPAPVSESTVSAPIPPAVDSSPAPTATDEAEEDALINDNFDEEDAMDVKEDGPKKRRGRPPSAAAAAASSSSIGADALDRLNELLQKTEQFAKFLPSKVEKKKGSATDNRNNYERSDTNTRKR